MSYDVKMRSPDSNTKSVLPREQPPGAPSADVSELLHIKRDIMCLFLGVTPCARWRDDMELGIGCGLFSRPEYVYSSCSNMWELYDGQYNLLQQGEATKCELRLNMWLVECVLQYGSVVR